MKSLGKFSYSDTVQLTESVKGRIYFNEQGEDWREFKRLTGVFVAINSDSIVVSVDTDITKMTPFGFEILQLSKEEPRPSIGDLYLSDEGFKKPELVLPAKQDDYETAIQNVLEETARSRRYNQGANAFATYVNSSDPYWSAEALAFVEWRDAVWRYAYDQLNAVQAGERQQPTVEALLAELPAPTWPDAG